MCKKIVLFLMLVFLSLAMYRAVFITRVKAEPDVIRVPTDYSTIQAAINAASPGEIILVSAGTYYEHVIVDKALSLVGEGASPVIDGNGTGEVVSVMADNVYISGFTLQNGDSGIWLNSDYNTIHGNTITKNIFNGITANYSHSNRITQNKISNNGDGPPSLRWGSGISLRYSHANIISDNSISNNVLGGIALSSSHDNIVNHNTFTNNSVGVDLSSSSGNIVSDNVMTLNENGVSIEGSTGNTIEHNQISNNTIGVGIGWSSTNVIRGNTITENEIHGIAIADKSTGITVVGNSISKNRNGIIIHYSNGSLIYNNNFVNNTWNAPEDVYLNVNAWDNGYPLGGNYWSDYAGLDLLSGTYQNETGSDGVGDMPHTLYAGNEDRFPLMGPISFFDVGAWNGTSWDVHVVSNSTVSDFRLNKTKGTMRFVVTGPNNTLGFCRVTVPNIVLQDMWQGNYTVLVDGEPPLNIRNWTDDTYTHVYFTYLHSQREVVIMPEFPASIIPPLFMITTMCAVITTKKRRL